MLSIQPPFLRLLAPEAATWAASMPLLQFVATAGS